MNNDQEQWARMNEQELWELRNKKPPEVKVKVNWRKVLKQAQAKKVTQAKT